MSGEEWTIRGRLCGLGTASLLGQREESNFIFCSSRDWPGSLLPPHLHYPLLLVCMEHWLYISYLLMKNCTLGQLWAPSPTWQRSVPSSDGHKSLSAVLIPHCLAYLTYLHPLPVPMGIWGWALAHGDSDNSETQAAFLASLETLCHLVQTWQVLVLLGTLGLPITSHRVSCSPLCGNSTLLGHPFPPYPIHPNLSHSLDLNNLIPSGWGWSLALMLFCNYFPVVLPHTHRPEHTRGSEHACRGAPG